MPRICQDWHTGKRGVVNSQGPHKDDESPQNKWVNKKVHYEPKPKHTPHSNCKTTTFGTFNWTKYRLRETYNILGGLYVLFSALPTGSSLKPSGGVTVSLSEGNIFCHCWLGVQCNIISLCVSDFFCVCFVIKISLSVSVSTYWWKWVWSNSKVGIIHSRIFFQISSSSSSLTLVQIGSR